MSKRKGHDDGSERKRTKYFAEHAKTLNKFDLKVNMKGLLFTVDPLKEIQSISEIKCLMHKYIKTVIESTDVACDPASAASLSSSTSVASQLATELRDMKHKKYSGINVLQTQVAGNYFVEIQDEDPCALALRIAKDLVSSGQHSTRFVYRMYPIHRTCRSHIPTIKEEAKEMWTSYSSATSQNTEATLLSSTADARRGFAINCKSRNNTGVKQADKELKEELAGMVDKIRYKTDLNNPDIVIWILTLQNITALGIGEQVSLYRGYNVHALAHEGPLSTPTSSRITISGVLLVQFLQLWSPVSAHAEAIYDKRKRRKRHGDVHEHTP